MTNYFEVIGPPPFPPLVRGGMRGTPENRTKMCVTQPLKYLTRDLSGIGGVIKQRPSDFLVEEQPLYEPTGSGEHLLLYVEKRSQTTSDVIRRVAKMFHVRRRDVGYAGLKDKHAITRQHLSVYLPNPTNDEKYLSRFEFTPFKLLWSHRHANKLRRGHLKSNRFVIYIRDVEPTAAVRAKAVVDRLTTSGMANYVGSQRFGYRQNNHILGKLLMLEQWQPFLDELLGGPEESDGEATHLGRQAYEKGDYEAALSVWPKRLRHDRQALDARRQGLSPREAAMLVDNQQREYLISALQSALFNEVLDNRIRDELVHRIVPGDLAWKHGNRSVFLVDEATAEKENAADGRVNRREISPSGPMWGQGMIKPSGRVLEWETQCLTQNGLSESDFARNEHAVGGRRPLRVDVIDPDVSGGSDEHGPYVRIALELSRGSFATSMLREIMKDDCVSMGRAAPGVSRSSVAQNINQKDSL